MNSSGRTIILQQSELTKYDHIDEYAVFLVKSSANELFDSCKSIFGRLFTHPHLTPLYMTLNEDKKRLGQKVRFTIKSLYECERYKIQYGIVSMKNNFTGKLFPRIVISAQDRSSYGYIDQIHQNRTMFSVTGSKYTKVVHGIVGAWVSTRPPTPPIQRKTASPVDDSLDVSSSDGIDNINLIGGSDSSSSSNHDESSDSTIESENNANTNNKPVVNNKDDASDSDPSDSPKLTINVSNLALKPKLHEKSDKHPIKQSNIPIVPSEDEYKDMYKAGELYKGYVLCKGPRGGLYYLNKSGNKAYLPKGVTKSAIKNTRSKKMGRYRIRLAKA